MIERVFVLSELRDDIELELRSLASASALRENPARPLDIPNSRDMGRGQSREHGSGARWLVDASGQTDGDLASNVTDLLPWRALADGAPVSMGVADAGLVSSEHGIRPAGTPYVVLFVDSWDAADAVQAALVDVAGLDDAEWTAGWTRSEHGFREITIYPSVDIAA